jgi:hypothetical protein
MRLPESRQSGKIALTAPANPLKPFIWKGGTAIAPAFAHHGMENDFIGFFPLFRLKDMPSDLKPEDNRATLMNGGYPESVEKRPGISLFSPEQWNQIRFHRG